MLAANASSEPVRKVTSVVRPDPRTGHLVRTVSVSPRPLPPKAAPSAPAAAPGISIEELVEQTARAYELDPALVHSIIKVESNYNAYAVSNKGAEGLMQLIPSTARRMGVQNSFDPKDNIEGGVRYYKYLQSLFGDDRLAIAAYNAGEAAVAKYNFQVPPYPETKNYVYQVGKHWGEAARRRKPEPAKAAAVEPETPPAAPSHPKLEQVSDEQGRVYLRTVRN
jgi:soluble lytic murein transglycosylase-like protein